MGARIDSVNRKYFLTNLASNKILLVSSIALVAILITSYYIGYLFTIENIKIDYRNASNETEYILHKYKLTRLLEIDLSKCSDYLANLIIEKSICIIECDGDKFIVISSDSDKVMEFDCDKLNLAKSTNFAQYEDGVYSRKLDIINPRVKME
jgi:hypothetical protein